MLDVAVAGNIFASPSAAQVFKAIRAFPSEQGLVMSLPNISCIKIDMTSAQNPNHHEKLHRRYSQFWTCGRESKSSWVEVQTSCCR